MQVRDIETGAFSAEHLDAAIRLSREAGWPHRPEDWQVSMALSEGVIAVSESGDVVGTALLTPYGEDCATINMVIVDAAMRGRGIGRRIMDAAIALGGERSLRLIATQEGLPLYEKLGFRQTGTVLQHQGVVTAAPATGSQTETATADDLAAITAIDREAFGADRMALLAKLSQIGEFAIIRRDGRISAFACIRAFGRGSVIGPVVAGDIDEARTLVSHFMSRRTGAFLRVDTTLDAGLSPWLAEHGLAHVGGGVAMARPAIVRPTSSTFKTFALANQAFG